MARPHFRKSGGLAAIALVQVATSQGFEGFLRPDPCPAATLESTATTVDAVCCTPADVCADGVPTSCGPNCALAMAELKWGPCYSKFVDLTDTADGQEANGISETMERLWSGCVALPTAWVQRSVQHKCPDMSPVDWSHPPAVGQNGGTVSAQSTTTNTHGAHRRTQSNSLSPRQQNEELLFLSVTCDDSGTTATAAEYPCSPCVPPLVGNYPTWDSEGTPGGATLDATGVGFSMYKLTVPAGFFADDTVANAQAYASICAQAGLHTVTTGDPSWGAPTAECAVYGCIALPSAASTDAPHWVSRVTGWEDCVTHGVMQATPVNTHDPYYGRTGWDRVLHPICAIEHE
jgi:hypothetical protein